MNTETFDFKFPVEMNPGFNPELPLDMKYDPANSYDDLFSDLQQVAPNPPYMDEQNVGPPMTGSMSSSTAKLHSIDDFQDLDVDLLGLVQGQQQSGNQFTNVPHSHATNTNIMYPSTMSSPLLTTPMSQISLTSQSISSAESLQTPAEVVLATQPPSQQPPQPQPQPQVQMPPQRIHHPPPPTRKPWNVNVNVNMGTAPTSWGAWGLGGSAAAAAAAAALSQHNGVRVSHIPVGTNPAPRKKLNEFQLRELEKVFQETPKPSLKTRSELERDLDLPKKNIQIWFQNRRAKEKQNIKKREGEMAKAGTSSSNSTNSGSPSAVRKPHMAAAAAAAAAINDNTSSSMTSTMNRPVMHITNANGKQVPTTTVRRRPTVVAATSSYATNKPLANKPKPMVKPQQQHQQQQQQQQHQHQQHQVTSAAPSNPAGGLTSSKHPSSTSLPALASSTNSDVPKRHRSNSSASFERRVASGSSLQSTSHSRANSTSVLAPPLERMTPAESLAAASMRRSNSFLGNTMSMARRGSETGSVSGHGRKNSLSMNHVTGQVGSMTSLTSMMTPSLSNTPSLTSGQVTPNTPQFTFDDGDVTPLNSPSAYTSQMTTPGPGPATPKSCSTSASAQFRDRSFSQSSLYGTIAENHTLETDSSIPFGNPVEFQVGGGGTMDFNGSYGWNGLRSDGGLSGDSSGGAFSQQSQGSLTSLSTSVDSMSQMMEDTNETNQQPKDDPYMQFVMSSMFSQDQTQENDEFYSMMGMN